LGRKIKVEFESQRDKGPRNQNSGPSKFPPSVKPPGCITVFVGNLSMEINDDVVRDLFKDCGEIKDVRWVSDKATGEFKRCGFVEFFDEEGPTKAMVHNGEDVLGKAIRIDYSLPKNPPQREARW